MKEIPVLFKDRAKRWDLLFDSTVEENDVLVTDGKRVVVGFHGEARSLKKVGDRFRLGSSGTRLIRPLW